MFKNMFKFISKSFAFLLKLIGGIWLLSFVGMVIYLYATEVKTKKLPEASYLFINLDDEFVENEPNDLISQIVYGENTPFYRLIESINLAASDSRIKGIVASINNSKFGLANAREVRNAILEFKKTGKKTIVFSESYGFLGSGTIDYYLASAFDDIWLQPTGEVSLSGLQAEVPFVKKALEKLGVKASFFAFYEYKTAASHFTDEGFTKEHKASLESLLASIFETLINDIALAQNLNPNNLKAIVNNAPLLASEALELGLVDKLLYQDEVENIISKEWQSEKIELSNYLASQKTSDDKNILEIAYINAIGTIVSDESSFFPQATKSVLGAKTISKAINDAANDDKIKAIILRVDSPGGEYVASDIIWREVTKAKEKKPVIASLGNYAASGGYFIAMNADKIIAQPNTITGSIGVLAGKLVLGELLNKLGINFETITFGNNAGFTSLNQDFSEGQKERLNARLEFIYKDFTSKVMAARKIDINAIDNIARGRVWTGEQALNLRLVDKLGGINDAVLEARKLLNLEEVDNVKLTIYPRPKTQTELIMDFLKNKPLVSIKTDVLKLVALKNKSQSMIVLEELEKIFPQNKALMMPHFMIVN